MPKASLHFKLPDESEELADAQNGTLWKLVVLQVLDGLRRELKYESPNATRAAMLEEFRGQILDAVSTFELSLD